jgi:predicted transcriptional regulator
MDALWLVLVVVLIALIVLYLSQTAARLDRLHHRIDTSRSALQGQFMERANEVLALASSGRLDPATTVLLADAADSALDQARATGAEFPPSRCAAESSLTRALEASMDGDLVAEIAQQPDGEQTLAVLAAAVQKAAWSRRFHNDAVRSCLAVRRQRLVRLFRLSGSAPLPRTVELDDEVPSALRSR